MFKRKRADFGTEAGILRASAEDQKAFETEQQRFQNRKDRERQTVTTPSVYDWAAAEVKELEAQYEMPAITPMTRREAKLAKFKKCAAWGSLVALTMGITSLTYMNEEVGAPTTTVQGATVGEASVYARHFILSNPSQLSRLGLCSSFLDQESDYYRQSAAAEPHLLDPLTANQEADRYDEAARRSRQHRIDCSLTPDNIVAYFRSPGGAFTLSAADIVPHAVSPIPSPPTEAQYRAGQ
jgi:hypothetical protein